MAIDPSPPAPAVVAVVVTRDPGPWLGEALASIEGQDYPNLSVLVVDAGSVEDPTPAVAAVAPTAFVRRLPSVTAFGAAANEVLQIVEGASHYLFCHDDVALEPDALRLMVGEAFRSNAGIVSPKLVQWDDPERLLAVGLTTDKVGARRNLVEPGELDQEQHDSVREVLVAPGGATLVRADLFSAMGGYGPLVEDHGEDMDLCWRARLYGARVVVAPQARVRHLESPVCPSPPVGSSGAAAPDGAALVERNRYRTLVTCYRWRTLAWVLPLAVFWALGEAVTLTAQGRTAQARLLLRALRAGLGQPGRLRRAHAEVQHHRTVPDGELRALQVKGNARLRLFVRSRVDEVRTELEHQGLAGRPLAPDPDGPDPDSDGRAVVPPDADPVRPARRLVVAVPVLIAAVFVIGSRSLFGYGLPQIGTLPDTAVGYGAMWHDWWSAWQPAGLGVGAPSSPGLALLGLLATVLFGALGTLSHVVVLGPLLIGPIGMWRAARHVGSAYARVAAAAVYAVVPLPYNALAGGHWDALVVYAGLPWVLSLLVRLSGAIPLPPVELRRTVGRTVLAGLVVAVVASVAPSFLVIVPVLGLCLVAGSAVAGRVVAGLRLFALAVASSVVALLLLLPWSVTVVTSGVALAGPDPGPGGRLGLGAVLRFHTGPYGSGGLEWLLLAAGALPLLVGREWRLEWAARLWVADLVFFGWAWAGSRGWVPDLPTDVLLVPAAAALALSAALGVSAFEIDLPAYNFGWRQAAAAVSALCVLLAALPWLSSAGSGRWDLPSGDASSALGFLPGSQAGDYRVLWVGYPAALPLTAFQLQPGVAYATSTDGEPDLSEDWPVGRDGAAGELAADLRLVEGGLTTDVGHLLAPAGVRYIVVPNHVGPYGAGGPAVPVPRAMLAGFGLQTDLKAIVGDDDYTVYQNAAWAPARSVLPRVAVPAARATGPGAARLLQQTDLSGARPVLTGGSSDGASGSVPGGAVIAVGSTFAPGWRLRTAGGTVAPQRSFGDLMTFTTPAAATAPAHLGYQAPFVDRAGLIIEVVLWVGALFLVVADRRRRSTDGVTEATDPAWFEPDVAAAPTPAERILRRRPARPAAAADDAEEAWTDVEAR